MKQGRIVQAYRVIEKLAGQDFPLRDSYKLFRMKKQLQPVRDFRIEEEKKLFEKHPITGQDGNMLNFATQEDAQAVNKTIEELNGMEADVTVKPITLHLTDAVTIAPAEIELLEGFVEFADDGEPLIIAEQFTPAEE